MASGAEASPTTMADAAGDAGPAPLDDLSSASRALDGAFSSLSNRIAVLEKSQREPATDAVLAELEAKVRDMVSARVSGMQGKVDELSSSMRHMAEHIAGAEGDGTGTPMSPSSPLGSPAKLSGASPDGSSAKLVLEIPLIDGGMGVLQAALGKKAEAERIEETDAKVEAPRPVSPKLSTMKSTPKLQAFGRTGKGLWKALKNGLGDNGEGLLQPKKKGALSVVQQIARMEKKVTGESARAKLETRALRVALRKMDAGTAADADLDLVSEASEADAEQEPEKASAKDEVSMMLQLAVASHQMSTRCGMRASDAVALSSLLRKITVGRDEEQRFSDRMHVEKRLLDGLGLMSLLREATANLHILMMATDESTAAMDVAELASAAPAFKRDAKLTQGLQLRSSQRGRDPYGGLVDHERCRSAAAWALSMLTPAIKTMRIDSRLHMRRVLSKLLSALCLCLSKTSVDSDAGWRLEACLRAPRGVAEFEEQDTIEEGDGNKTLDAFAWLRVIGKIKHYLLELSKCLGEEEGAANAPFLFGLCHDVGDSSASDVPEGAVGNALVATLPYSTMLSSVDLVIEYLQQLMHTAETAVALAMMNVNLFPYPHRIPDPVVPNLSAALDAEKQAEMARQVAQAFKTAESLQDEVFRMAIELKRANAAIDKLKDHIAGVHADMLDTTEDRRASDAAKMAYMVERLESKLASKVALEDMETTMARLEDLQLSMQEMQDLQPQNEEELRNLQGLLERKVSRSDMQMYLKEQQKGRRKRAAGSVVHCISCGQDLPGSEGTGKHWRHMPEEGRLPLQLSKRDLKNAGFAQNKTGLYFDPDARGGRSSYGLDEPQGGGMVPGVALPGREDQALPVVHKKFPRGPTRTIFIERFSKSISINTNGTSSPTASRVNSPILYAKERPRETPTPKRARPTSAPAHRTGAQREGSAVVQMPTVRTPQRATGHFEGNTRSPANASTNMKNQLQRGASARRAARRSFSGTIGSNN
uniref:Uncharacterized protein n=1 Tax=Phaeomonas parva TaxID=124430 RepID=A0A7S1XSQ2_9STRA|mmetsp:Transcript_35458/g.111587  ORF Transcript_35458/g.111587 Transcript_35458/m.111587 type:complete len:990 (+) Transcript_35458:166-3135(+)